ncbi:MAG: gliding motility protein GldB [Flavobacteriaceae bacterium]|nr:gliding motility protein GldB [Flavobacteriaceae bacterium]
MGIFHKIFKLLIFKSLILASFLYCKEKEENLFQKEIKTTENIEIFDISGDFYNSELPLEKFKSQYPWFQGNIPDNEFFQRRKDTLEIKIYQDAIKNIDEKQLKADLSEMFSRVKFYFPKFQTPKVYLYSSNIQHVIEPIFFKVEEGLLFIDISAFMGENNENYKGIEQYLRKSMNPENILPKVAEIVAESFVMPNPQENKFIDEMLFNGKIRILQDAFLPNIPDYLKMNYIQEQQNWAMANEEHIWNYFVENDLLFSDDNQLSRRFISIAPFSKFYTEVDNNSAPQVGIFIGWQIAKSFFKENPKVSLSEFLTMNATDIFNKSKYKPAN